MTLKSSTFFLFSANFYHYKGPRQTKLSGVIPCQKFFVEPVLITTFVLSGRFYNRSKKDVIRLSMTTVTDVDCLNVITIRLSIVFGDCMQSAEVKSNVFYANFSSARLLCSQGELIVSLWYTHRDSVHPSVYLFQRSSLKPLCQSKPNFRRLLRNWKRKFV